MRLPWLPLLLLGATLTGLTLPAVAVVPAGFTDTVVTLGVASPTALAFTPDGRLLITSQAGRLYVYQGGALVASPALDLASPDRICDGGERGLLGVAVHPGFANNGYLYLYYTHQGDDGCDNRVSRFTLPGSNVIDPLSELVLLDNIDSPASNHNAGDLEVGGDGYLYVTVGDGGSTPARAQQLHWLNGKVLRITDDGEIPPSNPVFAGTGVRCHTTGGTSAGNYCQEIFAYGFRNPFRFGVDPNSATTRFFVNDVGQSTWEEIDELQAGGNYGWSLCEGNHNNGSTTPGCANAPAGHLPPIFEWMHDVAIPGTTSPTTCGSITGGAFVPAGLWPGFDGAYLFGDLICGVLARLDFDGGSWVASDFGSGFNSLVHLEVGPYCHGQALYYTRYPNVVGRIARDAVVEGDLRLHTVTPCRLVDTREPPGPAGGPVLASGVPRSFTLTGSCGVPATARALAVNLTVVQPSADGHLTVFASDEPACTSALNFRAGQTRANNATLRVDALGAARAVAVGGNAHLIVDVVGYFAPP